MHNLARQQIDSLLAHLAAHRGRLVIDADTHATDLAAMPPDLRARRASGAGYYHGRPLSAEELLDEMRGADVDLALIWQNPAATPYSESKEDNHHALLAANRYIAEAAQRHPTRFIPAGWVDPKALGLEHALALVDTLVDELGFLFIKMNPAQNRFPIDSEPVMQLVDAIVARGGIPAFHFGADTPFTPASGLARVASRHPNHPVLAVHMGGGGAGFVEAEALYHQARELGLRQPSIRYVLSAKRDTHLEDDLITYQLAGDPFCRNLFCASDAPYGRMAWNFGGYRSLFATLIAAADHTDARVRQHPNLFTPEIAQRYLGGNFADFVVEGYSRLLGTPRVSATAAAPRA